jgi:hypothetical protein
MKRITFFIIFLFIAVLTFGMGQRESFELGLALPYFVENQNVSGVDVKSEMTSVAVNFSGVSYFTGTVGLGVYGNLIFPSNMTLSASGQSVSVNRSDYDFLMALDALIGPVFMLYKKDKLSLPLSVGIHYLRLWSVASAGSTDSTSFGLGANITQEYFFNKKIYIFVRLQLTLDIYAVSEVKQYVGYSTYSQTNVGGLTNFGINPMLGVGFSW